MRDTSREYNRFINLDNLEWRIIDSLLESDTKHANNIWKLLAYNTPDCLLQKDLTRKEKINLIHTGNGDVTTQRIFMSPYIDTAMTEQCSHLHIFVDRIIPRNAQLSTINIAIETVTHNKLTNIISDADTENPKTNPSELKDGEIFIMYKSRATMFLKAVLAELNGMEVGGIGPLVYYQDKNSFTGSQQYLWNNRAYYGHSSIFTVQMSGISDDGSGY